MKTIFGYVGLICAVAMTTQAEVVKIELPVETGVYKAGPGADLANAQCLACHSVDYTTMQPPMPSAFWKAEVDKMIGKYGAPMPTNQVDELVAYLTKNYGVETNGTSAVSTSVVLANSKAGEKLDAKALAMKVGCFNCHNTSQKIIGPAYKDVAAKYKDNPDALAKVSHQISNGGSGQWGIMVMPPFKQLSSAEIKALGEWILSQK